MWPSRSCVFLGVLRQQGGTMLRPSCREAALKRKFWLNRVRRCDIMVISPKLDSRSCFTTSSSHSKEGHQLARAFAPFHLQRVSFAIRGGWRWSPGPSQTPAVKPSRDMHWRSPLMRSTQLTLLWIPCLRAVSMKIPCVPDSCRKPSRSLLRTRAIPPYSSPTSARPFSVAQAKASRMRMRC